MKQAELVIDIGSRNTTVCSRGVGVLIHEPTVAAISNRGGKMTLVQAGRQAERLAAVKQADFQILNPVKEGTIFHERAAALMYREFIRRAVPYRIFKPKIKVIACVSCGIGNMDKRTIERVLLKAGADEVTIIESPLAVFEGMERREGAFVIDIGASKSEIAVCDENGIIAGCSLNIGGDTLNNAIVDYVVDTYRCKIRMSSAEDIKKQIVNMYDGDRSPIIVNTESLHGEDRARIKLTAAELREPVGKLIDKIVEVAFNMSAQIPESIAMDICNGGITLCGGTAYMPGLADYIERKLEIPVYVPDMPETAAAMGALGFYRDKERLAGFINVENL